MGTQLRFVVTRRKASGEAPPLIVKIVRHTSRGEKIVESRQRIDQGTVRFRIRKPGRHTIVMRAAPVQSTMWLQAFRKDYPARVRLTTSRAYAGDTGVAVAIANLGPWRYELGSLSVFQFQAGGWIGLRERAQPDLLVPAVMQYIEPGDTGGSYALLDAPLIPGRYRAEWHGRPATGPEFKQTPFVEFGVGTEPDPCQSPPGCNVPALDVGANP